MNKEITECKQQMHSCTNPMNKIELNKSMDYDNCGGGLVLRSLDKYLLLKTTVEV